MKFSLPFFALLVIVSAVIGLGIAGFYPTSDEQCVPGTGCIHVVALGSERADPDILVVVVGDYVQFNSADGNEHQVAQGSGNDYGHDHGHSQFGLASDRFGADEGYRVEFKKPGTYYFHDHLYPHLFVTVVAYTREQP